MKVHIRAYGEKAYMLTAPELDSLSVRRCLECRFLEHPLVHLVEHVWGAGNLLLIFEEQGISVALIRKWFAEFEAELDEASSALGTIIDVPVVYDGTDLEFVAEQTDLSVDELVQIHSAPIYSVRLMGFSPGFPYLDGLDSRLQLARRAEPRKRIRAGSVAIGGPHAGMYSVPSPGGWHILGHTDLKLFRPELASLDQPEPRAVFAFQAGDRLRFIPQ